jgi:phenylpropionate dioxygenase-like ring-hydroxylating dioxygenase large terminal subunit
MGSKLDNAKITNTGCLKCQYHGMEFSNLDKFGETIEQDGKIFWAYNPESKKPESIPFYNNKNYVSSIIEIDMPCSLSDSAYNTLDMRHPEFVHSLGFGSSAAPTNIKQYQFSGIRKSPGPYYYNDKRIGLSFDYSANEIMRKINNNAKNTNNFHMFVYPSFSWSRVTFQKKNLIIGVNFLPLSPNKTRWYVTICHNYSKSSTGQEFIKLLASTILSQDYIQMKNQYQDNELKKAIMFEKVFSDEEAILWLKELFNDYKYPDVQMCTELYKNYKQ